MKLPAAGTFDVAFLLNQPQIIHCFSTQVSAAPDAVKRKGVHAEFLGNEQPALQNTAYIARVRILGDDGEPRLGLRDLSLRYFLAPSSMPRSLPLQEMGMVFTKDRCNWPRRAPGTCTCSRRPWAASSPKRTTPVCASCRPPYLPLPTWNPGV